MDDVLFAGVKKVLDKAVDEVFGVEFRLYSDALETAGRCDQCVMFQGEPAIVDIKTSTNVKKKQDIRHYFQQATAYALMFEERTGLKVPKIVIIIATEAIAWPQVFIDRTEVYEKEVRDIYEANRVTKLQPNG
jgi:hypothetical protein